MCAVLDWVGTGLFPHGQGAVNAPKALNPTVKSFNPAFSPLPKPVISSSNQPDARHAASKVQTPVVELRVDVSDGNAYVLLRAVWVYKCDLLSLSWRS